MRNYSRAIGGIGLLLWVGEAAQASTCGGTVPDMEPPSATYWYCSQLQRPDLTYQWSNTSSGIVELDYFAKQSLMYIVWSSGAVQAFGAIGQNTAQALGCDVDPSTDYIALAHHLSLIHI